MKTKNLFLSLFACAAICACNKEAQPEGPQVLGEDACLSVRIMAAGVETKAPTNGGFQNGDSTTENVVDNVLFAFFASDGTFMYTRTYDSFNWTAGNYDPNVEKQSNVQVVLDGKSIAPRQMVVVLNYTTDMKNAIDKLATSSGTVANMYSTIITDYHDGASHFVMSNSSYADGTVNAFAAQIDESDIYDADETPTEEQIVDVYVERVAAKLTVTESTTLDTKSQALELHGGTSILYYPDIVGYAFTGTRTSSYLCKNIEGQYTALNANWPGWNDPTNKRSYWGVSYEASPANIAYVDYDDINNDTGHYVYCNENMTNAYTKLIVKTVIRKQEGVNQNPSTDPALSIVKVGTVCYLKSALEEAIINELAAAGVLWSSSGSNVAYTTSQLKYEAVTGSGYLTKIVLDPVPSVNEGEAVSIMNKYSSVMLWDAGQSYFSTKIEHLGNNATGTEYGVVRNHIYNLTINSIAGLGTPYFPGIGGDGGDPIVPDEVDHKLSAQINILDWKVVNQGVDLN